jgi:hypothetical protein
VQLFESVLAAVSFLTLSHILHTYGLRRTLLLDKIIRESVDVQLGFNAKLKSAFSMLAYMLLPTLLIETCHRAWYSYATISAPYVANLPRVNLLLFTLSISSWLSCSCSCASSSASCALYRSSAHEDPQPADDNRALHHHALAALLAVPDFVARADAQLLPRGRPRGVLAGAAHGAGAVLTGRGKDHAQSAAHCGERQQVARHGDL